MKSFNSHGDCCSDQVGQVDEVENDDDLDSLLSLCNSLPQQIMNLDFKR